MANSFSVTNNSKDTKLVVIDVYTTEPVPVNYLYEQTLQLISSSSSQPYVASNGGYETFGFPAPHKDSNGTDLPYTFIIADATTLRPVCVKTVGLTEVATIGGFTIEEKQIDYIKRVLEFIQNIAAFPTSDLAMDFAAALKDEDTDISVFFKKTKSYPDVQFEDVALVYSYYSALPYGWVDGKNTKFYLYSKDYKNNTDTDEPVGHLEITNDWSLPLPVKLDTDKCKISLSTYDDKKTISLEFKDGAFWDSTKKDIPLVALKGSFIVPSQFTMENSRNDLEAYVIGSLNGYDVFGLNGKAPHDQDDDGGFLDTFKVHNFKEGLDLALYFVGIGTAIAFFVGIYYGVKYVKNKFTSDDALETHKKAEELKETIQKSGQKLLRKVVRQVDQMDYLGDVQEIQGAARTLAVNKRLRFAKINLEDIIDSLGDSITALGNTHVDNRVQTILDDLGALRTQLAEGNLGDIADLIDNRTSADLEGYNTTINEIKGTVVGRMSAEQKKAYKEAQEAYQEVIEVELVIEEQLIEIADGENLQDIPADERPPADIE